MDCVLGSKIQRVYNSTSALIEIVKYGSKIFTEPDVNKKSNSEGNPTIHAAALDSIFKAMKGLRIFERFGFNLPNVSKIPTPEFTILRDYDEWIFEPTAFDWLNTKNEKRLADYNPIMQLVELLNNNIDITLK